MNIKHDKADQKLLFQALCYFDMHEDGNYDQWFGKDASKANESFHYLYRQLNEQ